MEVDTLTSEVQVVFKTTLPAPFKVEETQIQLSSASSIRDLTEVLTQLLDDPKTMKGRKLNFMVQNTFLSSTLGELLTSLN